VARSANESPRVDDALQLPLEFLIGLDLHEVDLRQANLSYARLVDATLVDANLTGAKLNHTRFDGATVRHTKFDSVKEFRHAVFTGAKLSFVTLRNTCVYDVSFRNATLTNTSFIMSTVESSRFDDATLGQADFRCGTLRDLTFERATVNIDLRRAKFDITELAEALGKASSLKGDTTRADFHDLLPDFRHLKYRGKLDFS